MITIYTKQRYAGNSKVWDCYATINRYDYSFTEEYCADAQIKMKKQLAKMRITDVEWNDSELVPPPSSDFIEENNINPITGQPWRIDRGMV